MDAESKAPKLYSPLLTVIIAIGVFLGSQFVAGFIVSLYPLINGWDKAKTASWFDNNVWVTFFYVAIVESLTLYAIHFFLKRRGASFRTLGINKPVPKYLGYTLLGFVAYLVLYIAGILAAKALFQGLNLEQKQEIGFSTATTGIGLVPIFITLVILAPIAEEIVVRGFLFGGLRSRLAFTAAALIASLLFAVAHLGMAKEGLLWPAAIDTFILSLVLCYLREKTGSLWPSIGVHMLKNALAFIVLFNIMQYIR